MLEHNGDSLAIRKGEHIDHLTFLLTVSDTMPTDRQTDNIMMLRADHTVRSILNRVPPVVLGNTLANEPLTSS